MGGTTSLEPSLRLTDLLASVGKVLLRGLVPIAALNAVPSLPVFALSIAAGDSAVADLVALPVSLLLLVFAQGATIAGAYRLLQGDAFRLRASALQAWQNLSALAGAAFLAGLLVLLGLAALIIPGLMAISQLYLTLPACVIEQTGMAESLERSGELTSGHRGLLFALFILTVLPALALGAVAAGLGDAEPPLVQVLAEEMGATLLGMVCAVTATVAFERLRCLHQAGEAAEAPPDGAGNRP